jgi:UDPglucose 6-dehydrogenase
MNLGVIGAGIVGSAYIKGLKKWGHRVSIYDIKLQNPFSEILNSKIVFICVPSPSKKNGECDTSIIESVIRKLNLNLYKGEVVICSTVFPGFTKKMQKKYKKVSISCVPELLRERFAYQDFIKNSKVIVIGTKHQKTFNLIRKCFPKSKKIFFVTTNEAEIFKYFNNVYASLRVVFANIFYEISKIFDADYAKVKNIYIKTGKAKDIYLDVNKKLRGYAGVCLPKDTLALIKLIKNKKLKFNLIESIHKDNQRFKKTVFKGMRK